MQTLKIILKLKGWRYLIEKEDLATWLKRILQLEWLQNIFGSIASIVPMAEPIQEFIKRLIIFDKSKPLE